MPAYSYTFDAKTSGTGRLMTILRSIDDGVRKLVQTTQKYGQATGRTTINVKSYTGATQRAGQATDSLFRSITKSLGTWNTWNKAWDFLCKRISQAVGLITGFISKIGQLTQKILDTAGGFALLEQRLHAYLGEGREAEKQLETLTKKASELGKLPGITAEDALKGMISLKKAGSSYLEILKQIEPALRLHKAENLTIGASVQAIKTAWSLFRKELEDSERTIDDVANLLSATASASQIESVDQITKAFANGGESAQGFGLSIKDTLVVLGQLSNRQKKSGQAGTVMRGIFGRLSKDIPAVRRAFRQLGISIEDSAGNIKKWPILMGEFQQAFAKIDRPIDRMRLYEALAGRFKDQLKSLVEAGVEGFSEMNQKIDEQSESLGRLQRYRTQTMIAAWETYASAISNAWNSLRKFVKIPLRTYYLEVAKVINTVADRFRRLSDLFKDARSLDDWIRIVRAEGFTSIFEGLVRDIAPFIDKLRELFAALWKSVKRLTIDFFQVAFPRGLEPVLQDVGGKLGEILGQAIAVGIKVGMREAPNIIAEFLKAQAKGGVGISTGTELGMELGADIRKSGVLQKFWQRLKGGYQEKAGGPEEEAVQKALTSYYKDQEAKDRDRPGRRNWREWQEEQEEALAPYVSPRDRALGDYAERQRQRAKEARAFIKLSPEEKRPILRKAYVENLKAQVQSGQLTREELEAQKKLLDTRKRYNDALSRSKTIMESLKLRMIDLAEATQKYLLAPFDKFLKRINEIRDRFADLSASLQEKKIGIQEKYLGMPEGQASAERRRLLEKQLQLTQKRIQMSQLPSERAEYEEKAAGIAEKLGGMTGEKRFARQALKLLTGAERSRLKEEGIAVKLEEISRRAMQARLPVLESMKGQATGSHLVEVLNQLQASYKSLRMPEKLQRASQEMARAQLAMTKEQGENARLSVEYLRRLVELAEQTKEIEKESGQTLKEQLTAGNGVPNQPILMPE